MVTVPTAMCSGVDCRHPNPKEFQRKSCFGRNCGQTENIYDRLNANMLKQERFSASRVGVAGDFSWDWFVLSGMSHPSVVLRNSREKRHAEVSRPDD